MSPVDAAAGAFPSIVPGSVRRWGGAAVLVARRTGPREAPVPSSGLSPAERRVVGALPARRRAEWLAGRLLAKRLVGEAMAAPEREVEVLPRDDGSPYVVVGGIPVPALHVSISHTGRHVAAALAPEPVGVDLCETGSADAVRRVAEHAFSPGELTLIGADRAEALAGAWALKEAAVKADRSSVFGSAPRAVALLGLAPPRLGGRRRAMVWRAGGALLALVLARPRGHCVGAPCPAGSCLSVEPLAVRGAVGHRQSN
ncbi:4'-phosphopantetheinyl transferase family protein [Streptomyces sp. NPDC059533]|uniref:4'-phosphopantetheinyl transferase family protein n=1 Tax=unclassified Streptomyces TaxID=2593676 RepID=UPI003658CD6F